MDGGDPAFRLLRQFRGFRDTDTGKLLTHIVGELHALHALYRKRAPTP
jgi:hypothetical protein